MILNLYPFPSALRMSESWYALGRSRSRNGIWRKKLQSPLVRIDSHIHRLLIRIDSVQYIFSPALDIVRNQMPGPL